MLQGLQGSKCNEILLYPMADLGGGEGGFESLFCLKFAKSWIRPIVSYWKSFTGEFQVDLRVAVMYTQSSISPTQENRSQKRCNIFYAITVKYCISFNITS